MNLLELIFSRKTSAPLSVDDERALLTSAQAGDQDAMERLALAYAPALNSAVSGAVRAGVTDRDELQAQALVGFLEAVRAWDGTRHTRLAAIVKHYIADEVSQVAGQAAAYTVPERTLKRFFQVLRKADQDVIAAAALAPTYHMSTAVFLAVLAAVRSYETLSADDGRDGIAPLELIADRDLDGVVIRSETEVTEDAILVDAAFAAVEDDPLTVDVLRLAYGFTDYDPCGDAEVGHRLGLSRPAAQRRRTAGLATMRSALGA